MTEDSSLREIIASQMSFASAIAFIVCYDLLAVPCGDGCFFKRSANKPQVYGVSLWSLQFATAWIFQSSYNVSVSFAMCLFLKECLSEAAKSSTLFVFCGVRFKALFFKRTSRWLSPSQNASTHPFLKGPFRTCSTVVKKIWHWSESSHQM